MNKSLYVNVFFFFFCILSAKLQLIRGIWANLGTDDCPKMSIGDLHTRVHQALASTMLHVHLDQVEEVLLVADRGRAMALMDLLFHKF